LITPQASIAFASHAD